MKGYLKESRQPPQIKNRGPSYRQWCGIDNYSLLQSVKM